MLDLIEQLDVGEAIPSERQLSADLGVSRLTLRAALDDLAREGYVVRRRGSGTFVSEPKIAQELTMTSFTDDMRRRGMVRLEPDARAARLAGRRAPRPPAARLALGAGRDRQPASAGRRRDHGDRDAARAGVARPGPHRAGSRGAVVLRAPPGPLRHRHRRRHADDRADRDGRGGVRGARRPSALARLSLRAVTHSETGEIVEFVRSIYRGDRYRLVTALSVPQERRRTRAPSWARSTARRSAGDRARG